MKDEQENIQSLNCCLLRFSANAQPQSVAYPSTQHQPGMPYPTTSQQPGMAYPSAQPPGGMSYPTEPDPGMPSAPPAYSYQPQDPHMQPGQPVSLEKKPPFDDPRRTPPPAYE